MNLNVPILCAICWNVTIYNIGLNEIMCVWILLLLGEIIQMDGKIFTNKYGSSMTGNTKLLR
jgi:hypothetical protein